MTFGPIQFGGLASGLDTAAIIDALLRVESRPIRLLETRKGTEESKLSLIGKLEELVDSLRTKAHEIGGSGRFFAFSITPSVEGVASFTLTGQPVAGSHDLEVETLASADRYAFAGVVDPTTDLGAGSVSFDYDGTSYSIAVDAASSSLNEIAAAIEEEAGDDVVVSVINAGTSSSPSYQLVIAGRDTGADFTIDNLASSVAGLTGATNLTAASNARVVIDGLTVERSSNVFDDVIEGISFTALAAGESTGFSVEIDSEGSKARVQELLDSYNAVVDFLNAQSSYDPDSGPGGELFGDSALRSVRAALHSALFDVDLATVQADTEGYSTLGLVGIELQTDGRLELDADTFEAKLAANPDALEALFTDDADGVLSRLESSIDALVDSSDGPGGLVIDGLFDRRRETLNTNIRRFDRDIERLQDNLERLEASLVQRFANLEGLLGGLSSQQAFLSSYLAQPLGG
jgi:flagellar hook-associated protein 2